MRYVCRPVLLEFAPPAGGVVRKRRRNAGRHLTRRLPKARLSAEDTCLEASRARPDGYRGEEVGVVAYPPVGWRLGRSGACRLPVPREPSRQEELGGRAGGQGAVRGPVEVRGGDGPRRRAVQGLRRVRCPCQRRAAPRGV